MTPAPSDGTLRRGTDRTWIGTLHGYKVHVFYRGDSWCFAVINRRGHTETCPRAESFADGARRAREWIERQFPRGIVGKPCTVEQRQEAESGRTVELTTLQQKLWGTMKGRRPTLCLDLAVSLRYGGIRGSVRSHTGPPATGPCRSRHRHPSLLTLIP
jgi:transposase